MKKLIIILSFVLVFPTLLSGCDLIFPTQAVSIEQVLSNPERYNGKNITIEGYLFSGWEWFGIAESYKYENQGPIQSAGGWILIGGEPKTKINLDELHKSIQEIENRLYVENNATPKSLFGKVRVKGEFQLLGDKGQYQQIAPISMELLPWLPPPTSALPQGELKISKVPALGETAELTFSFYAGSSAFGIAGQPPIKAWVELERYDPKVYYPLGKIKRQIDNFVSCYENQIPPDVGYSSFPLFLKDASADQLESQVSTEEVVVSGSLRWDSIPSDVPNRVELSATVSFPDEGWWYVSGWMEGETWRVQLYDDLHLTVTKDTGLDGWPQDIDSRMTPPYQPIFPGYDMLVYAKLPTAPLANEPFKLRMKIQITDELIDAYTIPNPVIPARANIIIHRRVQPGQTLTSDWMLEVPLADFLIDGKLDWQGTLQKDVPINLEGTMKFPEGDWWISVCGDVQPSDIQGNKSMYERQRILLHVGKDKSWYSWPAEFPFDS